MKKDITHSPSVRKKKTMFRRLRTVSVLLALILLCGCTSQKEEPPAASSTTDNTVQTDSQICKTDSEPITLVEELLKQRNIPFDQSDYPKLVGGGDVININLLDTEFDCSLDHGYSKTVDSIIVSNGKLYRANFDSLLPNGKNIQEIGTLPNSDEVIYWAITYDGEMDDVYYRDGTGSKICCAPYSATPIDTKQYPLFTKVYRYAADGKSLEDHTAEYLNAEKIYSNGIPMVAFIGNKVSLLFPRKYLDHYMTGQNWYRDMGWREYIAFDLDLSAIGSETPIRLFNQNILMTNCAFYEIVYASEPLNDTDEKAQLAPDGSTSPYYPAAGNPGCKLTLRKLELLSAYYGDVRNICTSHVITEDYSLLPITEVITEGYSKNSKYNCSSFYWDYSKQ